MDTSVESSVHTNCRYLNANDCTPNRVSLSVRRHRTQTNREDTWISELFKPPARKPNNSRRRRQGSPFDLATSPRLDFMALPLFPSLPSSCTHLFTRHALRLIICRYLLLISFQNKVKRAFGKVKHAIFEIKCILPISPETKSSSTHELWIRV
jgi:hypothetical protein